VSDTDTDTYDYIELCHFFKLLSVSTCQCPYHIQYPCQCLWFIVNDFTVNNWVVLMSYDLSGFIMICMILTNHFSICRKSSGFSRGVSKYRGVARYTLFSLQNARICNVYISIADHCQWNELKFLCRI
jgi:hypothetical protein